MGTVEVVKVGGVISPFRARAIVVGRRMQDIGLQVFHNKTAMAGLIILIFFTVLAVAAPLIAPYGPLSAVPDVGPLTLPAPGHPFGTNQFGYDIYSQVIWGTQISLLVGVLAAAVASVIGTAVGLVSGFVGGWIDEVIMRFNDVVLMIVIAARLNYLDLVGIILVIGLTGWSVTARVVRSQVLSLKERMFVERGRMIGSSNTHILLRHIFPNAFPLIFANTILTVAISILSESVLAFLNLSVKSNVSWGRIIAEAYQHDALTIGMAAWIIVPGLCIVFLVFGFYLFGYALDEILNPRLRRR